MTQESGSESAYALELDSKFINILALQVSQPLVSLSSPTSASKGVQTSGADQEELCERSEEQEGNGESKQIRDGKERMGTSRRLTDE
jgi:hypothetical protein